MVRVTDRVAHFWGKCKENSKGCLIYQALPEKDGYVRIAHSLAGERRAHRIAWTLTNGKIPKNIGVLHRCDMPLCCNPEHLFLGTPNDNSEDMVKKGRSLRGSEDPAAKLTAKQVSYIKDFVEQGLTYQSIADMFGISKGHVSNIIAKRAWKYHE